MRLTLEYLHLAAIAALLLLAGASGAHAAAVNVTDGRFRLRPPA